MGKRKEKTMENIGDILKRLTPESGSEDTDALGLLNSEFRPGSEADCAICGNIGWLRVEVPVGHPSFGKAVQCGCQRRDDDPSRVTRLQRYSNMGPLIRLTFEATFESGNGKRATNPNLFPTSILYSYVLC